MTLKKDILRQSVEICKQSNLYCAFSREEKRDAVMHVYGIINESHLSADGGETDLSLFGLDPHNS